LPLIPRGMALYTKSRITFVGQGTTMISHWTKNSSETVYDARIFKLKKAIFRRDEGRGKSSFAHPFYYLDSCDWVNIVPVTPDLKVVLIRQFRAGLNDIVLETPGGMVEAEDRAPVDAARRELLEETGYGSDDIEAIGRSFPNPAILNNATWFFVAHNARTIASQNPDPGEDIEIEVVDLAHIDGLIDSGQISHALVLNAFDFLKRKHPEYWG
jgi:ADP-ribose pyrophosphatase